MRDVLRRRRCARRPRIPTIADLALDPERCIVVVDGETMLLRDFEGHANSPQNDESVPPAEASGTL